MNQAESLIERIDDLFANLGDAKEQAVDRFVAAVYEGLRDAEKSVPRNTALAVLSWGAFYALQQGVITEASVASLKFGDLKFIQLLGPVAVGWFAYTLACAVFASVVLSNAYARILKHTFPAAYERDLEVLLGAPNFFRIERMYRRGEGRIHERASDAVNALQLAFGVLGTLAMCSHAAWIAWQLTSVPLALRAVVVALGFVLWLRAALLWIRIGNY